uniref:Uncharacterized protein n=1 Tax=Romanomermis culicivorax TaxID=13658 RepID=A0A915K2Q4_ROMCU
MRRGGSNLIDTQRHKRNAEDLCIKDNTLPNFPCDREKYKFWSVKENLTFILNELIRMKRMSSLDDFLAQVPKTTASIRYSLKIGEFACLLEKSRERQWTTSQE